MRYAVIFTVDTPSMIDADIYEPVEVENWSKTEGDEQYERPGRFPTDPDWEKGHHRKWFADLDEEQFKAFIDEQTLTIDGEGSSLGAIENGFSKAVVFIDETDDYDKCAYVTPHCDTADLVGWLKEQGERIPSCLVDGKGQRYLFKGVRDNRQPWDAVVSVMQRQFA